MINRKIFRQYDIRGVVGDELTEEYLFLIGKSYGSELRENQLKSVVIGGDARLSTPKFKESFINGMLECGIDVTDIGIVATPVLYFAIWKLKVDGGVMITASHNPAEYNGIKMNIGLQSVYGEQIQNLYYRIKDNNFFAREKGSIFIYDKIDSDYIDYIKKNIKISRGVKVVIDAGNGVGGPYLPKILRELGCDVTEIYCDVDGKFPNHHPDPTIEKNNFDLIKKVKEVNAELGLGLDGDADRIGLIDENGKMYYGDQTLNIIARDFLTNNPGEIIIADVKCSKNLFDDIKKYGGQPVMYKTGHANIKNKMYEDGVKVAGEMSGHIFLGDRYLGFDDAIYVGCRLIEIVANSKKKVSQFLSDQPKMFNTPEIHIESTDENKFMVVEKVKEYFENNNYRVNDIDGVRVIFEDGWGLCRASNTTPVIVLRFEAENKIRLDEIQNLITTKVNKIISLS